MTRVKKTRSLKRIHKTKTGSISKFKKVAREAGGDRQGGKRVKGRKVLSVYEKFLQENPDAREKTHTAPPEPKVVATKAPEQDKVNAKERDRDDRNSGTDLLDQLESKNLNDFY
ncbi:hypothetical protein [Thalassolituus marinus]|uniref:Uncharacterized protein n=1 Tax=Thalassolituus marinus TaxID=671053 RepID=A0ABS7ZKX3_9GAMM|nr:hypothetical protein [Thalassolituus marinus]MCA6062367.1 hypothetical protein [Thalassolituus marinus]